MLMDIFQWKKWHGRPFTRANINDLKFIQIALSFFDEGRL